MIIKSLHFGVWNKERDKYTSFTLEIGSIHAISYKFSQSYPVIRAVPSYFSTFHRSCEISEEKIELKVNEQEKLLLIVNKSLKSTFLFIFSILFCENIQKGHTYTYSKKKNCDLHENGVTKEKLTKL